MKKMTKITKKNSILYNQLWINKAIEDGNMSYIPIGNHIQLGKSIGEYIEERYKNFKESPKITKHNSLLFEIEWIKKAQEDNLKIPKPTSKYTRGEILELLYFEKELLKPNPEEILYLKGEKIKKKYKKS